MVALSNGHTTASGLAPNGAGARRIPRLTNGASGLPKRQNGAAATRAPARRVRSRPAGLCEVRPIRMGLVGCGHWGPNHIRNFASLPGVEVAAAADMNPQRLAAVGRTYPAVKMHADSRKILRDPGINAVVIATPATTHFELAREAMLEGKDVLCEKPLAADSDQCRRLVELADSLGRILMVGHVFLFNAGIRKLHDLIADGKVGRIYYAHATRTNLGPIREDVNAAWDLASHDISTFNYLFGSAPLEVSATGGRFLQREIEDVVFISLAYPKGIVANIHVSWINPKKIRELTVVGDKTMCVWNDLDAEGPIRIYDKGIVQEPYYATFGEFQLSLREGDVAIPRVRMSEPLRVEAEHFIECVRYRKPPMCDGRAGFDVVRTLESVDASLAKRGCAVRNTP